jgi:hypothetical protein
VASTLLPLAQLGDARHWFLVAAMALLIGLLLLRARRFGRRRDAGEALVRTPRPPSARQGLSPDAPADLSRWEVEIHETARDLSARLDSKMSALEALVAEADRAAARLEAALDEARSGQRRPPSEPATGGADAFETAEQPQSSPPATRLSPEALRKEIAMLADYGFPDGEIARRLGVALAEVERTLAQRAGR